MTQLATSTMSKSNLSRSGLAFLMVSLGTACSSSEGAGAKDAGGADPDSPTAGGPGGSGNSSGAGTADDAGSSTDDGTAPGTDGATSATDGGRSPAGGSTGSRLAVNLGTAANFTVLAKSGISTVPTSAITGNLGISPAAATYITGFALTADSTKTFSTSTQVIGHVLAATYSAPTPSNLTTAVGDMQHAFTDAAGRAAGVTELGAGNIGGKTLAAGVYKWSSGLLIPTNVTLTGSATDVWIFQIAGKLTVSNATKVVLSGGAIPKNVFWQVSGLVDVGTTAHFEGVILGQTSIALRTGASINGRLLAQTAVTLDSSTVVAQ